VVWLISLFLLASFVSARPYDSYTADFTIVERNVVVNIVLDFLNEETGVFYFSLPEDARTIDLYIDNSAAEPVIEEGRLKIELRSSKRVRISYVTGDFLDKNNFLVNLKAPDDINNLTLQVSLPEKAVLRKQIIEGDITSGSIHPNPELALTDGRSMIFIWKRNDLSKDDELSVFVQYKPGGPSIWPIFWVLLIAAMLAYLGYNYMKEWRYKGLIKRPKKEAKVPQPRKPKKELGILKHLKEEEQQIIRVLQQKEGKCEQGTLRIITDFSKAHLSRLLMELEARKIIHKEKKGKKNIVYLKKG